MEKTVRACDVCGEVLKPEWAYECEVCGADMCAKCVSHLETGGEYTDLCPEHYKQVKEYIEGLKKPSTWWTVEEAFGGDGYQLWRHDDSGGILISRGDVQITTAQADALFGHMLKERREHEGI